MLSRVEAHGFFFFLILLWIVRAVHILLPSSNFVRCQIFIALLQLSLNSERYILYYSGFTNQRADYVMHKYTGVHSTYRIYTLYKDDVSFFVDEPKLFFELSTYYRRTYYSLK